MELRSGTTRIELIDPGFLLPCRKKNPNVAIKPRITKIMQQNPQSMASPFVVAKPPQMPRITGKHQKTLAQNRPNCLECANGAI